MSLFGLPFAAVGVFMAYRVVAMVWLATQSAGWVETPATLLSVGLEGSDSKRVVATYHYDFDGQRYESDRVGVDDTADNLSSYHRDQFNRLDAAHKEGETVPCYVDPADPSQALLDRRLRPVLLVFHAPFVICFGLVGFGLIIGSFWVLKSDKKKKQRLEEHPDEPWRVRDDWAAGEIRDGGWTGILALGGFALFWNSIAMPFALVIPSGEKDVPWWVGLIIGGFVLVGVGMAGATVYEIVRRLRFGGSTFRMANVPGVVGGELAGVVLAPENVRAEEGFRVTLACEETRPGRGDDNSQTVTIWEEARLIDQTLHDSSGKRGVPIRFVIPSSAQPTDPDAGRPINWKLRVHAKTPGPDYKAEFETPVYRTADSRDGVEASSEALTDYEQVESLPSMLAQEKIAYEQLTDEELRVTCPPGRHLGTTIMFGAMAPIFGGVAIGVPMQMDEWSRYLFGIGFGAATCGLGYGMLASLLASSDLKVQRDAWRLKTGWYGFRGAWRELRREELKSIVAKEVMTSTSGNKTTKWNNLVARTTGGDRLILVRGLKNRQAERWLLDELRGLAGITRGKMGEGEPSG